jgi:phosphoserine aminotransferase
MSSDFLSRPFDAGRYALIYAHAQKNLGPAGVTVVLVREAVLERAPEGLPAMLDYRAQAQAHSILNTPPVFAIYAVLLVLRWLMDEIGGLEAMAAINRAKAERLYGVLDASEGFYRPRARRADRSLMNVVFDLPSEALRAAFLAEANRAGFAGLAGHRALGGIRVSIYNAVTLEAVEALADFMETFRRRH